MSMSNTNDERNRKSYVKVGRIYNVLKRRMHKIYLENLLQTEGDINSRISDGTAKVPNLLYEAIHCDELFALLLDHGADFTYKDEEGRTVIHQVIQRHNKIKNINAILEAHVKFNNFTNPSDKNGITHFHAACMTDNASAVEFFLKNGVDVNHAVYEDSRYFATYTPLHFAVEYTRSEVIEILLKYGANVHLKNTAGLSPVNVIVKRRLEEHGNRRGFIDHEMSLKYDEILKIFIDFAFNHANSIRVVDDYGFCNLHIACILQDESLVEKFLDMTENINQTVNADSPVCPGFTALHFAAFSKVEVFKLLLDNGADIEAMNSKGEMPLDLCLQNYTAKDIYLILMIVPKWRNIVLSDNKTKLVSVVFDMRKATKPFSFPKNATTDLTIFVPFDSPLWPGYTILHLAVIFTKETISIAKINDCLQRGADVTVKNAKGSTPVHLAFYMNKFYVTSQLLNHHNKRDDPTDENNLSYSEIASRLFQRGMDEVAEIMRNSKLLERECPYYFIHDDLLLLVETLKNGMYNSQDKEFLDRLIKIFRYLTKEELNIVQFNMSPSELLKFYSTAWNEFEKLKIITDNPINEHGISLIHIVCLTGNAAIVEKFLKSGNADVNQTISYFSDDCPGSTPLHLVIQNYHRKYKLSSDYVAFSIQTFLRIVDVLLKNGANVNAADVFGDTPLFQAIRLPAWDLRKNVINKLISYGANIHVTNVTGNTPFDLLLSSGSTWEEIEVFLNAGCSFDSYNPITQEGYMSIALRSYFKSQTDIFENRVCREIINNPKIIEVNNVGRTLLHNMVSTGLDTRSYHETRGGYLARRIIEPIDCKIWAELIELFIKRGCDIDEQDNEGKTALHLAVFYNNIPGVYGLLKNGADVNVIDKNGQTVFANYYSSPKSCDSHTVNPIHDIRLILINHTYKLKFVGEHVCEQSKELHIEDDLKNYKFENNEFNSFHEEIKKFKNMKIGKTLEFSVCKFLMVHDMDIVYMNLTKVERTEVDEFFEGIGKYEFQEIDCLLKLKYRRSIERIKLLEPTLASFNQLIKWQMPDLCCRYIISFLKNEDMKRLIASEI